MKAGTLVHCTLTVRGGECLVKGGGEEPGDGGLLGRLVLMCLLLGMVDLPWLYLNFEEDEGVVHVADSATW